MFHQADARFGPPDVPEVRVHDDVLGRRVDATVGQARAPLLVALRPGVRHVDEPCRGATDELFAGFIAGSLRVDLAAGVSCPPVRPPLPNLVGLGRGEAKIEKSVPRDKQGRDGHEAIQVGPRVWMIVWEEVIVFDPVGPVVDKPLAAAADAGISRDPQEQTLLDHFLLIDRVEDRRKFQCHFGAGETVVSVREDGTGSERGKMEQVRNMGRWNRFGIWEDGTGSGCGKIERDQEYI